MYIQTLLCLLNFLWLFFTLFHFLSLGWFLSALHCLLNFIDLPVDHIQVSIYKLKSSTSAPQCRPASTCPPLLWFCFVTPSLGLCWAPSLLRSNNVLSRSGSIDVFRILAFASVSIYISFVSWCPQHHYYHVFSLTLQHHGCSVFGSSSGSSLVPPSFTTQVLPAISKMLPL